MMSGLHFFPPPSCLPGEYEGIAIYVDIVAVGLLPFVPFRVRRIVEKDVREATEGATILPWLWPVGVVWSEPYQDREYPMHIVDLH